MNPAPIAPMARGRFDATTHGPTGRARAGALRRQSDFRAVVREGIRLPGGRMVLYVLASEQGVRVGFAAGRGIGGAVRRNRVRRQLKEAWRILEPRLRQACDVVIVARPGSPDLRTQDLGTEMEELLDSFGALR